MSERQRWTDGSEIAFFKAPVIFGLGKSIGITGERLHNSFFKDVLSPVIDKTIMLNDSIHASPDIWILIIAKPRGHSKMAWKFMGAFKNGVEAQDSDNFDD